MENIRMSVLIVNLNTLDYTKQCVNDLLHQDVPFNLTIINQNSNEVGTEEYLDELFKKHIKGTLKSKLHVLTLRNSGYNKPLNKIWNDFVTENETEFICLLNNDVRIAPNFLSSAIQVLDNEPIVGFVNHVTNNKEYQHWYDNLEYEIIQQPYRQGWDPIFRRECYNHIPENLILYFGDDYIYSKLYYSGYKGAYVLNSPMVHLCSATTPDKGRFDTGDSDRSLYMSMTDVYHHLSFNEKFSKLTPEFYEILNSDRISIINNIIKNNNFKTYLEIGVRHTYDCFDLIDCKSKDSVDPGFESSVNNAKYKLTSDEFFKQLDSGGLDKNFNYKWDIIFIDGLHVSSQVELDIRNSLNHLSENGVIVVHDCNPPTLHHAREDYSNHDTPAKGIWNGTVWKTFFKMRCTEPNLDMCVVDCDWGVGLIKKGSQKLCDVNNPYFEYSIFDKNRVKSLNLIKINQYQEWLLNPFY
jgi:hypothetical protein